MKISKFASLLVLFLTLPVFGGTSVGNFYKTQPLFDFRIGYPMPWVWHSAGADLPGEIERWIIDNSQDITDPNQASSLTISFLDGFPAANDSELLQEIQKRHPTLTWTSIKNPDFTIGYVSNQAYLGPARTRSFEYFFSSAHKVIRIDAVRDALANGASQVDGILATIRRPSGIPEIVAIDQLSPSADVKVHVGDRICYRLEVNRLRTDYDVDSLSAFEIKGAPPHWSFKDVIWDALDSSFHVCLKANKHFGPDGLVISSLKIRSTSGAELECWDSSQSSPLLACSGQNDEPLDYHVSRVDNPAPMNSPPVITRFSLGSSRNSVLFQVDDPVRLATGEIVLDESLGSDKVSQIIYADQFKSSPIEIAFETSRLRPGFNRVKALKIMDDVGNAAVLSATSTDSVYTLYSNGHAPQITQIPVLNILGENK